MSEVVREQQTDYLSPEERSERMSRIRGKNTKPELAIRRLVHSMGYRYRLHLRTLPGRPDIVFAMRKKVIFVHGCFWHQHKGCKSCRLPKSKLGYWRPKLEGNSRRDILHRRKLRKLGWKTLVVWECEASKSEALARRIRRFLGELLQTNTTENVMSLRTGNIN